MPLISPPSTTPYRPPSARSSVAAKSSSTATEPIMAKYKKPVIGITAPVTISAEANEDGTPKGPARFETTFYTGGALNIDGWDLPVVVDLAGLDRGNVLVANLDH